MSEGTLECDFLLHVACLQVGCNNSVDVLTVWVSFWVLVSRVVWADRCRLPVQVLFLSPVLGLSVSLQVGQDSVNP
jgi:hypothetical protein